MYSLCPLLVRHRIWFGEKLEDEVHIQMRFVMFDSGFKNPQTLFFLPSSPFIQLGGGLGRGYHKSSLYTTNSSPIQPNQLSPIIFFTLSSKSLLSRPTFLFPSRPGSLALAMALR